MNMMLVWLFLACTLLCVVSGEIYLPCEEGEFVQQEGCTCWNPQDPIITCSSLGLTSIPEITKANTLILNRNNLKKVPVKGFQHIAGLKRLSLSNCKITVMSYDALYGVHESLEWLDLSKNELTAVPKILKSTKSNGLKNLITIDLSDNFIYELNAGEFEGLKTLEELHLNGNWIIKIHPDAWQGLASASPFKLIISVGGIDITSIPNKGLENLTAIGFIGGQPQKLSTLKPWFESFPKVQYLEMTNIGLQDNHLASGKLPDSWKYQLRGLVLKDNLLENIPLHILDLPVLHELDLSNNIIKDMWIKTHTMYQLKKLNISKNRLWRVRNEFLLTLNQVTSIDLSDNKLRWINWSIRYLDESFRREMTLYIGANPWNCVCGYSWLPLLIERQLANHNGHLSRYEINNTIRCGSPKNREGELIRDVPYIVFDCSGRGRNRGK